MASALFFVVAGLAASVPGVRFVGNHACPSPADVERAFAPIATVPPAGAAEETVIIERDPRGGGALIRFGHGGDRDRASDTASSQASNARALERQMSCRQRAQAAAVIVATHLEAHWAPRVAVVSEAPRADAPAVVKAAAPPVINAAATPPPATQVYRTDVEAGLLGARAGSLAAGGEIALGHAFAARDRLRLGLGLTAAHSVSVAGGQAVWSRASVSVGYTRRIPVRKVDPAHGGFFDLGAALLASRLRLGSEGFHREEVSSVFHPGLQASLRAGQPLSRRLTGWAGFGGTYWPRAQRVFLRDVPETTILPRFELYATVGASWAIW
jgi:hypothetical protein